MKNALLRIGEVSRLLRVSIKTLDRAEREGRITFQKGKPRRIIEAEVYKAYVLTLGQLAKRIKVPYSTLLTAAKKNKFLVRRSAGGRRVAPGYRHASLAEVRAWAAQRRGRNRLCR